MLKIHHFYNFSSLSKNIPKKCCQVHPVPPYVRVKYNKFYTNKFSSTLMSVGKPTEGKLGLVREKRGGREVGIIAIAYPTSLFP